MHLIESDQPVDSDAVVRLSIGKLLRSTARLHPQRIALVDGVASAPARRRISYGELLALAENGAARLIERYGAGAPIAIWAPNSLDWVILEFAAALAGLPLLMISPALNGMEAAQVLQQSKAVAIFVAGSHRNQPLAQRAQGLKQVLPMLRDIWPLGEWSASTAKRSSTNSVLPAIDPDTTAMIQCASDRTGRPSTVVQSHFAATNAARVLTIGLGTPPGSVWLLPSPLYSVGGSILSVLGNIWNSGTLVVPPDFDEGLILQLIEEEGVVFYRTADIQPTRSYRARKSRKLRLNICG